MKLAGSVKPITYLKNNTAELVRDVSENGRTVVVTQNGEAKVVVMDVATYDQWRESLALARILSLGEADITQGRTLSHDEVFRRARRAIERSLRDDD
jgi:prevent-host-death family protein